MKSSMLSIAVASASIARVCAFTASHQLGFLRQSTTTLQGTLRPDATTAISDALRISEEFGATSNEARVAWDIVEEIDSSDNSAAWGNAAFGSGGSDSTVTLNNDYLDHIRSLSYLIKDTSSKVSQMKQLVSQIKDMEITDPLLSRVPDDEEGKQLKSSLSNAKAAMEVHGSSSVEAKKAWEYLDNCFGPNGLECDIDADEASTYRYSAAALKAHHQYGAVIDTSLLDEAIDAFDMIEGLGKFVNVEKNRLDKKDNMSVRP